MLTQHKGMRFMAACAAAGVVGNICLGAHIDILRAAFGFGAMGGVAYLILFTIIKERR